MNMQQMVQAMNKMQRQYEKERKVLDEKEFKYVANGAVEVVLKGDNTLSSITFVDPEILKEDPEMVQDMIKLAFDGAKDLLDKAEEELANKFQKNAMGGLPF